MREILELESLPFEFCHLYSVKKNCSPKCLSFYQISEFFFFLFSSLLRIYSEFSRSPPPEPAPHDPALLAYKQQLHVQGQVASSAAASEVITNQQDKQNSSCNSTISLSAPLQNSCTRPLVLFIVLASLFYTLYF